MGRELQKRKRRSGTAKIRHKPKSKKRIFNNAIIAANWDPRQTLSQNYRRLGLATKLNAATGGVERKLADVQAAAELGDGAETQSGRQAAPRPHEERLAITNKRTASNLIPSEAKIERDPATGRILRVIDGQAPQPARRRLDDPLNAFDDPDSDDDDDANNGEHDDREEEFRGFDDHAANGYIGGGSGGDSNNIQGTVLDQLEAHVAQMQQLPKQKRKQSEREVAWIQSLVERHGDNYAAMARDRKLNIMQQSRGDIERRVRKFLAAARK